jgi:hypothetical protein
MGYVLLGHGRIEADPAFVTPEMRYVAIPQGTKIRFYCAADQSQDPGSREVGIREMIQAPWPPLDSSHITCNLALRNAGGLWNNDLADNPEFGGHTVIVPGCGGAADPIRLCTGTRATCPTEPRHVANGATHGCDGILGTLRGDLYWLACNDVLTVAPACES